MAKYRKKPVEVEAYQLVGGKINFIFIAHWCGGRIIKNGNLYHLLIIRTLEGDMRVDKGDWVIKGVKGEFYPCKPDIFEKTYELVCN